MMFHLHFSVIDELRLVLFEEQGSNRNGDEARFWKMAKKEGTTTNTNGNKVT